MKHTIRYIVFCLVSLCAFGMQAQRSFRVHKSDGNMQSFFYSSLDSITFSKTDLNGVSHDNVVVQEFHTTDSVYRIPLADIDSVAFTVPPTVYKPDAVKIEGQLRQYVVRADSLTLWLQGNTPENIIPKNGSNIVTLECDDVLPYGFVGKVRNVEKDGDCIKVDCAQASLFDVFEKVYIEVDAATGTEVGLKKSPSRTNAWPPESKEIKIETIGGKYDFEEEFKPSDDFSGEFNQSIGFELATPKFIVNTAILIDGMQFSYSMTTIGDHRFSLTGSVSGKVRYEKEIELASVRNLRIPGIASFIEFFASAGLYFNFDGNAALGAEYTRDYKSIIHYEYSNNSASSIPDRFTMKPGEKSIDVEFEGDARLSFGLSYGFGIAPIVKELASVETTMKHGVTFYLPELIKLSLPVNKNHVDTLLYDKLNRNDYLCGNFDITGAMKITLLDVPNLPTIEFSKELDLDDYVRYNPVWKWGIVPEFKDVSMTIGNNDLNVRATVGRKLLKSVKTGFGVYDSKGSIITYLWNDKLYKDSIDKVISVSSGFYSAIEPGADSRYIVFPLVEAFGIKMRATPASKTSNPVVTTGDVYNITDRSGVISISAAGYENCSNPKWGIESLGHRGQGRKYYMSDSKFYLIYNAGSSNERQYYRAFFEADNYNRYGYVRSFKTNPGKYTMTTSTSYNSAANELTVRGIVAGRPVYDPEYMGSDEMIINESWMYGSVPQSVDIENGVVTGTISNVKAGGLCVFNSVYSTSNFKYTSDCCMIFIPNNIGLKCEILSKNGIENGPTWVKIQGKFTGKSNYSDIANLNFIPLYADSGDEAFYGFIEPKLNKETGEFTSHIDFDEHGTYRLVIIAEVNGDKLYFDGGIISI